ncbi:MAG: rubrerythrin family protein [Deltaproteobacteria bacterium]|nr:rubrerythrin family protein [Deltaproteobacteria bacterium]
MTTTADNLATAFAGESQANRKYLAFAQKAEKEGFASIARLFRAAAEAETIHALGHFTNMGGVGSTQENLKAAVAGETYEHTKMYPPMLEQAIAEGHRAKIMFGFALKAEEVHAQLYTAALKAIESGKDLEGAEIYLCPVCGHIEIGKPTAKCPICGALPEKYRRID